MRSLASLFSFGIAVVVLMDYCVAQVSEPMTSPEFCRGLRPPMCPRILDPQCTSDGTKYDNVCLLCGAIRNGEQPEDVSYEPCHEKEGHKSPRHSQ